MVRPSPDLLARPAVCGHPTGMILTRARTLLRPCFARLLAALVGEPDGFAAGAFHARPLPRRSKSRRARKRALGRQSALRPLRFAPTIVRRGDCLAAEKHMPLKHPLRVRAWHPRELGQGDACSLQASPCPDLPLWRVFLRSFCARRCPIGSLNLARSKTAATLSAAGITLADSG